MHLHVRLLHDDRCVRVIYLFILAPFRRPVIERLRERCVYATVSLHNPMIAMDFEFSKSQSLLVFPWSFPWPCVFLAIKKISSHLKIVVRLFQGRSRSTGEDLRWFNSVWQKPFDIFHCQWNDISRSFWIAGILLRGYSRSLRYYFKSF